MPSMLNKTTTNNATYYSTASATRNSRDRLDGWGVRVRIAMQARSSLYDKQNSIYMAILELLNRSYRLIRPHSLVVFWSLCMAPERVRPHG